MTDLIQFIKREQAFALNHQAATPVSAIFFEDASVVRSDCDSQLIIVIPFSTAVRLTGIAMRAGAGEEPTICKLYLDKRELSFEDVEDTRAAFDFKGAAHEVFSGKAAALPPVKFPACSSVTLFFDAEGKDTVALSRLVLFGSTVDNADVSKMTAVSAPARARERARACKRRPREWLRARAPPHPRTLAPPHDIAPPPHTGLRAEAAPQLFQDGGRRWQGRVLGY